MDIAVVWDGRRFRGDWGLRLSDLSVDPGGLVSAVMLSLFTDRVAPPGYLPPVGTPPGRRGWWGDTFEDDPIGSLLWTLDRSKKTDDRTLLVQVQDICRTALDWLLSQNIASAVDVQAAWQQADIIGIQITITRPSGTDQFDFDYAWLGA